MSYIKVSSVAQSSLNSMLSASERSTVVQQRVRSLLGDDHGSIRECDVGYWDCNTDQNLSWRSPTMYKLFDINPRADAKYVEADFFAAVHPDDVSSLHAKLEAAREAGGRFTTTYRVLWKNGKVVYIKASGGHFMNSDGTNSLVGTCVNITNLKQLRNVDMEQMQHEQALCRKVVRRSASCSAIRIAAFADSTDLWPWTLGNCFAQVCNLALVSRHDHDCSSPAV
jgi:PAS fold